MRLVRVSTRPLRSPARQSLLPITISRALSVTSLSRAGKLDVLTEVSRTRNIGIIAHIDAVGWTIHVVDVSCADMLKGQNDNYRAHALL